MTKATLSIPSAPPSRRLSGALAGPMSALVRFIGGGGEKPLIELPAARLAGPMPWVTAVMVLLTMLGAAAGLSLAQSSKAIRNQVAGRVTVQLIEPQAAKRVAAVKALAQAFRSDPAVTDVRIVPEAELQGMLSRWIGDDLSGADLPVPALIDVDLAGGASPEKIAQLQALARKVAPAARIEPHSGWLAPVERVIRTFSAIASALVLLLILASASIAILSARAALNVHRDSIEVLHLIGATDAQIAHLFQRRIFRDAAVGATIGTVLAIILLGLIGWQMAQVQSGLSDGGFNWYMLFLILLPILVVAVSVWTARLSIMAALKKLL